jgi:hypothetical protein
MSSRYFFPEAAKYNFLKTRAAGRNGLNYYRVGNDAINFYCENDKVQFCIATNFVKDVFVVVGDGGGE